MIQKADDQSENLKVTFIEMEALLVWETGLLPLPQLSRLGGSAYLCSNIILGVRA